MPRRVDYAAQFAFVREACFAIVHDRGVHELSRRAVATQLGISDGVIRRLVDPACRFERLAADEVATRRRAGRWSLPNGDTFDVAVKIVLRLVPDAESRAAEELVWLRLVLAAHPGDDTLDDHRTQREEHVSAMLDRLLDVLRVPTGSRLEVGPALRAFVDGLTIAVCTGRIDLDAARTLVHSHLTRVSRTSAGPASAWPRS